MSSQFYIVVLAVTFATIAAAALICDVVVSHNYGTDSLCAKIVHIAAYWVIAVSGIVIGSAIMAEAHKMATGTVVSFVDWVRENTMLATLIASIFHILIMTPVNRFNRFSLGFAWLMTATFSACIQFIWNDTWLTLVIGGIGVILILNYHTCFDKPQNGTGNDIFDTIDDIHSQK